MQREIALSEMPHADLLALRQIVEADVVRLRAYRRSGVMPLEVALLPLAVVRLAAYDQEVARRAGK